MNYLSTSCLILFFLFSLFHHLPCASSEKELKWCETLFQCGNITAGFPFWGGDRPKVCGHPSLELHCYNNITSLSISNQEFNVLQIDQPSNNLTLARTDHMGSFCSSTFTNTTLPQEFFELFPTYKTVTVFYHCFSFLRSFPSGVCLGLGPISTTQKLDNYEPCHDSFTINVPKRFISEEKVFNLTRLESVLRKGFKVKLKIDEKACQECLSSQEFCGFNESSPLGVKCGPLHPPTGKVSFLCITIISIFIFFNNLY